ncbi:MAG: tetratricopeptide repeat protein [Candidatus Cloacimonadales bacterium]
MKRKILLSLSVVILASSLMAANMKVAILDFAKKDRNSDYVVKSMMRRDLKQVFKDAESLELIDLKDSQELAEKSGYTNLFYADISDIKAMGTELGAAVVVWGEVQERPSGLYRITSKILSMKSSEVVQISFDVEKSSKPRREKLAENLVTKIQEFSSGEVSKLFGIATQYYNSRNYPEAERTFLSLLELDPTYVDAYFYLGLIKFNAQDFAQAVMYYNSGLELEPENVDLLNFVSKAYERMGNVDSAADALRKINDVEPDKEILLRIGDMYADVEYYEQAAEAYNEALELDPEFAEAYMQLAQLYYDQDFYDAAIEPFEAAVRAFPDDEDLQRNLARCYDRTGKIDSAIAQYKSIIAEQPENVRAYLNLTNAYLATEQFDLALETASQLLEMDPDDTNALILLANAHNSLKNYQKAREAAEAVIKIDAEKYQPYRIISDLSFERGYAKYEEFLELEEKAKTVYGEEADRLVDERDRVKQVAYEFFEDSKEYLNKAKAKTSSNSEIRYINSRMETLNQLLKATEKDFF